VSESLGAIELTNRNLKRQTPKATLGSEPVVRFDDAGQRLRPADSDDERGLVSTAETHRDVPC
jgi:hypothetical protein